MMSNICWANGSFFPLTTIVVTHLYKSLGSLYPEPPRARCIVYCFPIAQQSYPTLLILRQASDGE
jgi:hypothetical protein